MLMLHTTGRHYRRCGLGRMRTRLWRMLLGQYRPIAVPSYAAQVSYKQLCVTKTARAVTGGGRAAALNSVTAASFHLTTSVAFCVAASLSLGGCLENLVLQFVHNSARPPA